MALDTEALAKLILDGFDRQEKQREKNTQELRDEIHQINGNVRALEKEQIRQGDKTTQNAKQIEDHEERIRKQERSTWWFAGLSAFLGTASGTLTNLFQK